MNEGYISFLLLLLFILILPISFTVFLYDRYSRIRSNLRPAMPHPTDLIIEIWAKGQLLAKIIPAGYDNDGINFVTGPEMSQQVGVLQHPKGHKIPPHIHNHILRESEITQEVLFIKSGRVAVDFYDTERVFVETKIISAGDILILLRGGHGFEVLDNHTQIIESKSGPYQGAADKTRFKGKE